MVAAPSQAGYEARDTRPHGGGLKPPFEKSNSPDLSIGFERLTESGAVFSRHGGIAPLIEQRPSPTLRYGISVPPAGVRMR